MLDIGWSELLVIAVVALIVIGPKDLPKALRTVGLWTRKAREVAREFQGSIDEMMREAELDEVKKQVKSLGDDLTKEVEKTAALADVSKELEPPKLPDLAGELSPPPPEPKPEPKPEPAAPSVGGPAKDPGQQP